MSPREPSGETLRYILDSLLPLLLAAALSAKSLTARWRRIHADLSLLLSSLSAADATSADAARHPLLLPLLPPLLSTLRSLHALSSRCLSPTLPPDRLRLQSDLDAAAAALALHLRDLNLLLRAGLLHRPAAGAIVLPLPGPAASRAELALFVSDAFTRLQIGAADLRRSALDSLLRFLSSDPPKLAPFAVSDGDPAALVRLLLDSDTLLREQAVAAVSLLAAASDVSRKALFEEGVVGPLLRLLEAGPAPVKEHAAKAIEAITADAANAWVVSAYCGVPVLVEACRQSCGASPSVRALAAAALRNVSGAADTCAAMVEEDAVPVFIELLVSGNAFAQKSAAFCLQALTSMGNEEIASAIVKEGALQCLLPLLTPASDAQLVQHALRAIRAISASRPASHALLSSVEFFLQLAELIQYGQSASMLAEATAAFCELSPSDESKKAMAGCMPALVKTMEVPKPAFAQEAAAQALVMLLTVQANRRCLARDEKSMTRLVQMLDPEREEVCKQWPVLVVLALVAGGSGGVRRKLVEAGACHHLQRLADANVAGAKKALQRIASSRLKNIFSMAWRE